MLVEHWQWLISALHSCCEVWREDERQVGSCRAGRPLRFPFCLSDGEASTRFLGRLCFRRPFQSAHRRYWETTFFFFIWCKWGNQYDNPALAIVPVTTSYKSPCSSRIKCPLCVGSSRLSKKQDISLVSNVYFYQWNKSQSDSVGPSTVFLGVW